MHKLYMKLFHRLLNVAVDCNDSIQMKCREESGLSKILNWFGSEFFRVF
jgi:hypothetical protein